LPDYPEDHVESPPKWRNFHAYGARLLRDGLYDSSYLVWDDLHDLEWNYDDEILHVICDWLDVAGDKLFTVRGDFFTPEEWDSWTKILENIRDSPKCDEKLRSRIVRAVDFIKSQRIEYID